MNEKISRLQADGVWVSLHKPAANDSRVYSRLPAEIPTQWISRPYELRNQMAFVDRGWDGTVVCGSVYFRRGLTSKARITTNFPMPISGLQIMIDLFLTAMCGICIAEALRPGTVDADSRMSARQPVGDVPRQHHAEVSHELVLRTQNAVDTVERNCLDENASCGPHMLFAAGIIGVV